MDYVIEMLNITKEFPGIIANDDITLRVKQGEIHALLGENGAGKSTLMSVLFGLYQPEKGVIKVKGKEVSIKGPLDANALGIGMVHQHFMLVPSLTVAENIILGVEPKKYGFFIHMEKAISEAEEIAKKYNFDRFSKREKRDKNEIGFSSIRGGNIVGEHTVSFFGENETFEITHKAYSRGVFAEGALKGAEFLIGKKAGYYTMEDII